MPGQHGSELARNKAYDRQRQVDPASYTASGMHPEMAAEMGSDYEHNAMRELMETPPQQGGGEGYYTYKKDRPPDTGSSRYLG